MITLASAEPTDSIASPSTHTASYALNAYTLGSLPRASFTLSRTSCAVGVDATVKSIAAMFVASTNWLETSSDDTDLDCAKAEPTHITSSRLS